MNQLLSTADLPDISNEQLDKFRRQYSLCSFRCRFTPCTSSSLGFPSESVRAFHEKLHVKRLFCGRPNCARGRIGFARLKDLDTHNKTYHEEGSILVPLRIRKVPSQLNPQEPEPPTPATPITPVNPASFTSKPGQNQPAPSPSKMPRLDGPAFTLGQGTPASQVRTGPGSTVAQASQLLLTNGINPTMLTPAQLNNFVNQPPAV